MTPKRIVVGLFVIALFVVAVDVIKLFTRQSQLSSSLSVDAAVAIKWQYDEDQIAAQIRSSLRDLPTDEIATDDFEFTVEGLGEESDLRVHVQYVDQLDLLVARIPIEMTASGFGLWARNCPDCEAVPHDELTR